MNVWLQITAGQGPGECRWVVAQVVDVLYHEAAQQGIDCKLLEGVPGDEENILKSALLELEGEGVQAFAAGWEGTIQWIGKSPCRPNHKRKNWFVGVEVYAPPQRPQWSESDLRTEVMRSSGPGGQHVNKTNSAV
jgi:peptide chain release factor